MRHREDEIFSDAPDQSTGDDSIYLSVFQITMRYFKMA